MSRYRSAIVQRQNLMPRGLSNLYIAVAPSASCLTSESSMGRQGTFIDVPAGNLDNGA